MTEVYRDKDGGLYLYNKNNDLTTDECGNTFYSSDGLEKVHLQPPEYRKQAEVWDRDSTIKKKDT